MGVKIVNTSDLADYSGTGLGNSNPLFEFFNKVSATVTERTAYLTFQKALIGTGVWDKILCMYPIHGSTATTQRYNMMGDGYHLSFINDKTSYHTVAGYVVPEVVAGVPNGRAEFSYTLLAADTDNFALGMYNSTSFAEAKNLYQIGSIGTGETNVSRSAGTPITAAHANGTWVTAPSYDRTRTGLLSVCLKSGVGYLMDNNEIIGQTTGIANAGSNQNSFFLMGGADTISGGGTINFAYLMGKGATTDDVKALSNAISVLLPALGR